VPDPNAFGEDVFSYTLSDCPFDATRQPRPATVAVSITPVNDPPVAENVTIPDLSRYIVPSNQSTGNFSNADGSNRACLPQSDTAVLNLGAFVYDIDNDINEQAFAAFVDKGSIRTSLEGRMLSICSHERLPQGGLLPIARLDTLSFDILYTVTDPGGLAASGMISFRSVETQLEEDGFNTPWLLVGACCSALVAVIGLIVLVRRRHRHLQDIMVLLFTEVSELAGSLTLGLADFITDALTCDRLLRDDFPAPNRNYKAAYATVLCVGAVTTAISFGYRVRNAYLVRKQLREHVDYMGEQLREQRQRLGPRQDAACAAQRQAHQNEWELVQTHRTKVALSLALSSVAAQGSPPNRSQA
jgi:hypothetical protein